MEFLDQLHLVDTCEEYRRSLDQVSVEVDELRIVNASLRRRVTELEDGAIAPTRFERLEVSSGRNNVLQQRIDQMEMSQHHLMAEVQELQDANVRLRVQLEAQREARFTALHQRVNNRQRREAATTIQKAFRSYSSRKTELPQILETDLSANLADQATAAASSSSAQTLHVQQDSTPPPEPSHLHGGVPPEDAIAASLGGSPYVPPLGQLPTPGIYQPYSAPSPIPEGEEGDAQRGDSIGPRESARGSARDGGQRLYNEGVEGWLDGNRKGGSGDVEQLLAEKDAEIQRLQAELSRVGGASAASTSDPVADKKAFLAGRGQQLVQMSVGHLQECLDEILRSFCTPKKELEDIRAAQHKVDALHSSESFRATYGRTASHTGRRLSYRLSDAMKLQSALSQTSDRHSVSGYTDRS